MLSAILSFILAWYNLPFTLLLATCLLLAGMQWIGLGGGEQDSDHDLENGVDHDIDPSLESGVDHDVDHDVDVEHDIDHDADLDHDVDAEHDLDHDADVDHDVDHDADHDVDHDADHELGHPLGHAGGPDSGGGHGGESSFSILAYLGVGRAPLMVTLLLLFASVGLLGWGFNGLVLQLLGSYPGAMILGAGVVSLGAGSFISSRITRAIGRVLPPISTTATPARGMVGRRGTVISPYVDERYGMVHLRDAGGTLISVFVITHAETPIRRNEEVILVDYDASKRIYTAVRADHRNE